MCLMNPTVGLDPMGVIEIMKLIKETREQLGISVVIATDEIDIIPLSAIMCI